MKTVALLPARGGSKRIPRKNIIELAGKPLIAHNIISAQKCDLIDEVWISTDNPQIEGVAKNFGAKVHQRPKELAGDTASSESALLEFTQNAATSFDILCFMQATSPLTQPEHLKAGIEMVFGGDYDSTLSVCEDKHFYWDDRGRPLNYDLHSRPRSQDVKKRYRETGGFYISKRESLLKSKCRVSGRIGYVIVPLYQSFEIDTMEDLNLIRCLMTCEGATCDNQQE